MPPTRWRRPDVPGASSCRRACALSGRAPEKVGWLYSIGHLVRTGGFSVFLTSAHAGVENFERELQVARADRVGRATGGSSPSPLGPMLKALKSISFNMGLKRSYSRINLQRRKAVTRTSLARFRSVCQNQRTELQKKFINVPIILPPLCGFGYGGPN